MKSSLAKLHNDAGLPVSITEYDISATDDNARLRMYQEHIPYFLETSHVLGITIWGWIYGQTWNMAPPPRLHSERQSTPGNDLADGDAGPPRCVSFAAVG